MAYKKYLAAVSSNLEPRSFKEAMKDPGWQAAMKKEIQALEEDGT